jgi:hypothetical protein
LSKKVPIELGLSQISQPNEQRLWGEIRIFCGKTLYFGVETVSGDWAQGMPMKEQL